MSPLGQKGQLAMSNIMHLLHQVNAGAVLSDEEWEKIYIWLKEKRLQQITPAQAAQIERYEPEVPQIIIG